MKIADWLLPVRKISEKEEIIVDVVEYLLSLENTEKVFPMDNRNCFLYNEEQNMLIKITGAEVSVATGFDIISETMSLVASNKIEKLIKGSIKKDTERLRTLWKQKEMKILKRVKDLIVLQNETIPEVREK